MSVSAFACLRVLVPSWRLFDRIGFVAKLYARDLSAASRNSDWRLVLVAPYLKWYALFFNPEGNLYHAYCNAVERLVEDPHDPANRLLVAKIVRHCLLQDWKWARGSRFQFKVTAREFQEGVWSEQDVVVSSEDLL